MYSDTIDLESVVLEKFRFGFEERLSRQFLDSRVGIEHDVYWGGLLVRISASIMRLADQKYYEYSYPDGWLQAFKDRWFPMWLLERFPVRLVEKRIEASVVLSEFHKTHAIPDGPTTIHFQVN